MLKSICPSTRDYFSRWSMAIAKIRIDISDSNLLGHTHRCFNHSPYLVDVLDVYFRYYDFKPTIKVSTHDDLRIGQENTILNDVWCIIILNDKPYLSDTLYTRIDLR